MKRVIACILLFCLCLPCAACGEAVAPAKRLSIVATIFPEYDFARAVAGDLADIRMLIKPGAETHSYDPTPLEIMAIQGCDVFLCVGGENDRWAQTILESLDTSRITVVRLMEIVDPLEEETSESMQAEADGEEEEYDEHVWTSPVNAMAIVSSIAETLAALDPANAEAYRANAAAYNEQIAALDGEIRALVEGAARRELIFGDRFPFLYFAREYGLSYDAAYPGCSTDSEASAATVASLIRRVREDEIPAVLYIELSAHRIADTIAEATGAKELLLHSCHNVTAAEFEAGETYVSLMRRNLDTLREALY